jgi:metallo-beta-lactamase class B
MLDTGNLDRRRDLRERSRRMPTSPTLPTRGVLAAVAVVLVASPLHSQTRPAADSASRARECPSCAEWNAPHAPFRVLGNTYYVGTNGLSAILITSTAGHILIDGGLPESAPLIIANVRAAGFRVEDVKLILNTHAHYDHAGGIAELQRASGGEVAGTAWSAKVMERGAPVNDDPQFGLALPYPAVRSVRHIVEGQPLRVGTVNVTPHFTGGHTPGGTTWTWRSCEGGTCADVVYADSQSPVSADGFLFSKSSSYPAAVTDFEHGFKVLETLSCDILLTPHPSQSKLWERLTAREKGDARALFSATGCKEYAADARRRLSERLAHERAR